MTLLQITLTEFIKLLKLFETFSEQPRIIQYKNNNMEKKFTTKFRVGSKVETTVYMSEEDVGLEIKIGSKGVVFAEPKDDEQLVGVIINFVFHYLPQDVLKTCNEYEVATFDSLGDSNATVVEGGLSYETAEKMAKELWTSGKYYGVEIIDSNPDNMEPIVWVKSKYSETK